MVIRTKRKNIIALTSTVFTALLAGCSVGNSLVKEGNVAIELVPSSSVKITRAYLVSTDKTLEVHGELMRRLSQSRLRIPGHLHIELVDPDDVVLKVADVDFIHKNVNSRVARFHLPIPVDLPAGSTVRVIHHDARSHSPGSQITPWRDADTEKSGSQDLVQ